MNEKNIAEIDLSAQKQNFTHLRGRVRAVSAETEPMCVVKADAYGHSVALCHRARVTSRAVSGRR